MTTNLPYGRAPDSFTSGSFTSTTAKALGLDLANFIALGSVLIRLRGVSSSESAEGWTWTEVAPSGVDEPSHEDSSILVESIKTLIAASWIRVFRPAYNQDGLESWRVYFLPHDVARNLVFRRDKRLQKMMWMLLSSILVCPSTWAGKPDPDKSSQHFDVWATREDCSLFYMFNTLPSPAPDPDVIDSLYMRTSIKRILDEDVDPWGIITKLYPYQRRSIAMMLQKELSPCMQLDPRFETRTSMTGQPYYYNARDSLFLGSPRYYDTVRGGILAETMGLGKTLICIATILATRGQLPAVPVQYSTQPQTFEHPPSLLDAAASAALRSSAPWKVFFEEIREATGDQHDQCTKTMESRCETYEIPSSLVRTMRKSSVYGSSEKITLCSGTIIVVPDNLVQQWESELHKHVRPGALRILVLKTPISLMPLAEELRQFDIVLFSRRRFEKEVSRTDDLYVSPLKDLHWLRIIIDEGQGFSSNSTNAAAVAEKVVRAERRWIVTGTPAKDLLGVEVDLPAMQVSDVGEASQKYREASLEKRRKFDEVQERTSGAVKSLGALASKFLHARPWSMPLGDSEEPASWEDYVFRHEDVRQRTYSSFSACFRSTLSSLVVKTQPEDVERDLLLPPLRHTVVRLEPSPLDKMTANLFVLLYTTNAITSERRDQDYLFHSNSRFHLLRLTANLRQSTFFWVGFEEESIRASLETAEKYLGKADTGCSPDDRKLLLSTMEAARAVLRSAVWKATSRSQEMGMFLNEWPADAKNGWLLDGCLEPPVGGLTQIGQAQRYVNKRLAAEHPLEGFADAAPMSSGEYSEQFRSREAAAGSRPLVMIKNGVPSSTLGDNFRPKQAPAATSAKASAQTTRSPQKPSAAKRRLATESKEVDLSAESPLGRVSVVGTASAKLSYLLDRVQDLQKEEKILIFYDGGHIAYYISQALDLVNIKHLIYANTLPTETRSKYIVLFDTDISYRVLVMDIKQAARGLNVSSASRVFFVNPPCRPDVEAQAIKRAHRIGQTRPVHVETLVLAGSIEEAIHDRAAKMTKREHMAAKALEDHEDIRSVIQSAKVMAMNEEELQGYAQMAPLSRAQQIFGRPGRRGAKAEGLEKEIFGDLDEETSPRATKTTPAKRNKRSGTSTPTRLATTPSMPEAVESLFGGG